MKRNRSQVSNKKNIFSHHFNGRSAYLLFFALLCLSACMTMHAFRSGRSSVAIRSFDALPGGTIDYFETDNVFFDGIAQKKAPWIEYSFHYDSPARGTVGVFHYDVRTGYAGYFIRLLQQGSEDYEEYNALAFWIRGDSDKVRVELKDSKTHSYVVRNITTEWQQIVIPFKKFSHPDSFEYADLKEIVFVVSRDHAKRRTGVVRIDDIAFIAVEEKQYDVRVNSSLCIVNGIDLNQKSHFTDNDLILDVFLDGTPSLNETQMRIEACGSDKVWFLVDQKPVNDFRATGHWDARFYPSDEYLLRFRLVTDEVLFTSEAYALSITNPYEPRAFIEKVLRDTFQYFLHEHHPDTFLTKDRSGDSNIISTGACGFALTVYPLAAERGLIPLAEARMRVNAILDAFIDKVPNIEGFYQHWFDFSYKPVFEPTGVDSVESSYLAAGALFCRLFYSGDTEAEKAIRAKAEQILEGMNWPFMLGPEASARPGPLYWLYAKDEDLFRLPVIGFNECLITYIMALRSSRSISTADFRHWYANYNYKYYYGKKVVFFPTLFTQQYSLMWLDPRNLKDAWVDYFTNAVRATHINREFSLVDQNKKVWGLTACDGPEGYKAYGVDLPFEQSFYDGTISPSASLGSMPFTPAPVIANARRIYELHNGLAYGEYGFYDSFNAKRDWSSNSFLGITQGVIYVQLENYLGNGTVWDIFMRDKRIRSALQRAGFSF